MTTTLMRRMVSACSALVVLGSSLVLPAYGLVAAASTGQGADLEQSIGENEPIGTEKVVIDHGHVDIGPRIVDGKWQVMARDDSAIPAVWRKLDDIVIRLTDVTEESFAGKEGYEFLEDSNRWFFIPQTEKPGVVWLGWNTQDPHVTEHIQRGVTMRIGPVSGPGRSVLFLQDGTFGKPRLLMDGSASHPADVWVDVNTHVHANWGFSADGIYATAVTFSGNTADGASYTHTATVRFAVGDIVNIDEAFSAQAPAQASADQDATVGQSKETSAQGTSSEDEGLPAYILILIGAAAALPIVAVFVVKSRASSRDAAEAIARARKARANGIQEGM